MNSGYPPVHTGFRDAAVRHDLNPQGDCWCGPRIGTMAAAWPQFCGHPRCPIPPDGTLEVRHHPVLPPDMRTLWSDLSTPCPCEKEESAS
jgi:hypothetical protein